MRQCARGVPVRRTRWRWSHDGSSGGDHDRAGARDHAGDHARPVGRAVSEMTWGERVDLLVEGIEDPGSGPWVKARQLRRYVRDNAGCNHQDLCDHHSLSMVQARRYVQAMRRVGWLSPPHHIRLTGELTLGTPAQVGIVEALRTTGRAMMYGEIAAMAGIALSTAKWNGTALRKRGILSHGKGLTVA